MSDAILFSPTMNSLVTNLAARDRNHAVIAGNVANADTPGYRARRLDFDKALRSAQARPAGLAVTSPGHIGGRRPVGTGDVVLSGAPQVPGGDGNGVELELEMARMADNQIAFDAGLTLLGKKLQGIMSAIREGK